MVKHILIALDEQEYRRLVKAKGTMTWAEYLLNGVNPA